jgi:hypothetical protein
MKLQDKGIKTVMDYERKQKRKPVNVSTKNEFVGFDVISISHDGKHRTIEVKTTQREKSIPDGFENEFTRSLKLVATHLYVVYFDKANKSHLYIVPKKEVDKCKHREHRTIRFNSTLQNQIKKFEQK